MILGDFEMTNILLLSVGTRNKVIQYFKKEFAGVGNVVVTDLTEIAPAIYEADKHYQVPRIIEDGYIDLILNICKKGSGRGYLNKKLLLQMKMQKEFLLLRGKTRRILV